MTCALSDGREWPKYFFRWGWMHIYRSKPDLSWSFPTRLEAFLKCKTAERWADFHFTNGLVGNMNGSTLCQLEKSLNGEERTRNLTRGHRNLVVFAKHTVFIKHRRESLVGTKPRKSEASKFSVLTENNICEKICLEKVPLKFFRSYFSTSGTDSITSHRSDHRTFQRVWMLWNWCFVSDFLISQEIDDRSYMGCECSIPITQGGLYGDTGQLRLSDMLPSASWMSAEAFKNVQYSLSSVQRGAVCVCDSS